MYRLSIMFLVGCPSKQKGRCQGRQRGLYCLRCSHKGEQETKFRMRSQHLKPGTEKGPKMYKEFAGYYDWKTVTVSYMTQCRPFSFVPCYMGNSIHVDGKHVNSFTSLPVDFAIVTRKWDRTERFIMINMNMGIRVKWSSFQPTLPNNMWYYEMKDRK